MLAGGNAVDFSFDIGMATLFIIFAIITGFFAGIIPATYFSKIQPITALRGSSSIKIFGKTNFKKILITSQFAISLFFIIGVLVQMKQTSHSINFDMGFNKENLLDVELQTVDHKQLKNAFSNHSAVSQVSMSSEIIGAYTLPRRWIYFTDRDDSLRMSQISVDENYLSNLGLELVAGNNFTNQTTYESGHILINETFCKNLGLSDPRDAVGMSFRISNLIDVQVTGVVKDFNYDLLRTPIRNFVFRYDPSSFRYSNLKVASTDNFTFFPTWKTFGKRLSLNKNLKHNFLIRNWKTHLKSVPKWLRSMGFSG